MDRHPDSCDVGWDRVSPVNVRDPGEIERSVTAFAHTSNGGMIVPGSALAVVNRNLIVTLAVPAQTARDLLHTLLRHRWRTQTIAAVQQHPQFCGGITCQARRSQDRP
jgi:hypothetical protein